MIGDIIDLLYQGLDAVWSWLGQIYQAYGFASVAVLITGVVLISAIARFLISPFVGGALSDRAEHVAEGRKQRRENRRIKRNVNSVMKKYKKENG